jgi:hypothetical protein
MSVPHCWRTAAMNFVTFAAAMRSGLGRQSGSLASPVKCHLVSRPMASDLQCAQFRSLSESGLNNHLKLEDIATS